MRRSIAMFTALLLASCGGQGGNENQSTESQGASKAAESGAAGGGDVTLQPGLWESTVEIVSMTMPNMPQGMTMPKQAAVSTRTCMTAEQLGAPGPSFFSGNKDANCTSQNFSMSGGRLQGTLQCEVAGTTQRMTMDGHFTPTSYEVTQHIEMTVSGVATEQEVRVTSHRVGDCPG
jgi:hypothetical protein